jgi:hypothetical protein
LTAIVPDPPLGVSLWTLYLVIDVALLVGWAGIYVAEARALGFLGGLNAALVAAAIMALIARDIFHLDIYQLAAAILLVALALMSLLMLRLRIFPRWIALCWIGAFAAGAASRLLGEHAPFAFAIAGGLFGLGFIGAGLTLMFAAPRTAA